jgi:hypothetical protein
VLAVSEGLKVIPDVGPIEVISNSIPSAVRSRCRVWQTGRPRGGDIRLRVSSRGVLGLVLFVGVGFAALRSATEWWTSGIFTTTLIGLAFAALYTAHRRGAGRAFWSGFVAFGAGYLILAFGPWFETSIRPRLLTTRLLDLAYPMIAPASRDGTPIRFSPDGRVHPIGEPGATARVWGPDASRQARFQGIGHSLVSLLLAAIGGVASRYFYAHRNERRREAAERAVGVMLKVLEAGL